MSAVDFNTLAALRQIGLTSTREEEKPHIRAAAQVTAPPRGLIVPEYDMSESESDSEEEEDEEEDEDEEEEDEEGEARPLYGTYRS